jgi:hypothetical protein
MWGFIVFVILGFLVWGWAQDGTITKVWSDVEKAAAASDLSGCHKRWEPSPYYAQQMPGGCMVYLNGKWIPEQNVSIKP